MILTKMVTERHCQVVEGQL